MTECVIVGLGGCIGAICPCTLLLTASRNKLATIQ